MTQLSDQAGVDRAYVSRVEHGHQQPSVNFLKRVAPVLGLPEVVEALAVLERFRP